MTGFHDDDAVPVDDGASTSACRVVVIVARSALAAAPVAELAGLARAFRPPDGIDRVLFAFSEQGTPSLRQVLDGLKRPAIGEVVILPLMIPMEPSFRLWLTRSIRRWQSERKNEAPLVRLGPAPSDATAISALLQELLAGALALPPLRPDKGATREASVVPAQKRRVLVCQGAACNDAGSAAIWGHLRNEQERLKLRSAAGGTMTARSTCLGPCSLAPVLQVFPEGTYYGGVTEAGIDRIIGDHLLRDVVVDELAYAPDGTRQSLRL